MNMDLKQLVKLDSAHIQPASETLTRAFYDYSLFKYFYPDAEERQKYMPATFQGSIKRCLMFGEGYGTSPYMEGIVLWLPSKRVKLTFWQMLRCGKLGKVFKEKKEAIRKAKQFDDYVIPMHKKLMPEEHMYLWVLGIDPSFQGGGLTTRLVAPMLERLDRRHLPCFVETHAEKNVPIYQHFGFEILDESFLPGTEIGHWALGRKPAPVIH